MAMWQCGANLEESGYLDNDKMLLQCYMRVESGSPWLKSWNYFFLFSLQSNKYNNKKLPKSRIQRSQIEKKEGGY